MRRDRKRRWIALAGGAIGALGLTVLGGWRIYDALFKMQQYRAGRAAAAEGVWSDAFMHYSRVVARDPDFRDVEEQLEEALEFTLEEVPGSETTAVEAALVHYLAAEGRDVDLADALERSMVVIPAGAFIMGSTLDHEDERPQRRVRLDAYRLDRYEVTNTQYRLFLQSSGREAPPYWENGATHPPRQTTRWWA
jgi:formylglycine-generating enzyme required for sulfatase activity